MPISLLQAKTLALAAVPVAPVKRVSLPDALGRFLAQGVSAKRAVPAEDVAGSDGWALASLDVRGAKRESPAHLRTVKHAPDRDLKSGEALKVLRGETVPFGADAVVRSEHAADDGHRVTVFLEVSAGQGVRRRGEEWRQGELLLPAGHRLDALSLGVLSSLWIDDVAVRPLTRVSLLSVADDLEADASAMLSALVGDTASEVVALERCGRRDDAIAGTLERCLGRADVVIACPSPRSREPFMGMVKKLGGTIGFDGVSMKPGRHAAVVVLRNKAMAVLPGPELATLAAYEQIARPMLLKRQGVVEQRRRLTVRLDAPLKKSAGYTLLVPARLDQTGDEVFATFRAPAGRYLAGAVDCDGWLTLPENRGDCERGDAVEIELGAMSSFAGLATNPNEETTR